MVSLDLTRPEPPHSLSRNKETAPSSAVTLGPRGALLGPVLPVPVNWAPPRSACGPWSRLRSKPRPPRSESSAMLGCSPRASESQPRRITAGSELGPRNSQPCANLPLPLLACATSFTSLHVSELCFPQAERWNGQVMRSFTYSTLHVPGTQAMWATVTVTVTRQPGGTSPSHSFPSSSLGHCLLVMLPVSSVLYEAFPIM